MYFKKLEIVGFKSFLNKTVLNFEPGVTAVVGPNGCGKSNLFDSIRWVLGEQSVKSLRGSEMQDVIFNGTDAKEPLSMAEVTLAFDNKNRFFAFDHDEVAITRRIFRSGESEYLLNKATVRLKDILELLMGTGVGAESYSLVAQGKIDLILSSKPEDRRLVFDEAAGITKYKTQKKEALRRLEETEQNLLRVNDIVSEVKRQISSLERQANKARRYKETFEELKSKEISLAIMQKNELQRLRDELLLQVRGLELRRDELSGVLSESEERIAKRQSELKALEDGIMERKNEIVALENLAAKNSERIIFNRERIGELLSQENILQARAAQIEERLKADQEKLEAIRNEYEAVRRSMEEKSAFLKEKELDLEKISLSIKGSLEAISKAKKDILDLVSRIAEAKNAITELASKEQILSARKKRLEIEKAKVNEEKAASQETLDNITREAQALQEAFVQINRKAQDLQEEKLRISVSLDEIKNTIEGLEKQKLSLSSKKEFLDKLRAEYEDISESMNAVIYLDKLPAKNTSGLVVRIQNVGDLSDEDKAYFNPASFKVSGEAKPVDLDTHQIAAEMERIDLEIVALVNARSSKEAQLAELGRFIQETQDQARAQEMVLVNKKAQQESAREQFNKIREEEEIINLELADLQGQFGDLAQSLAGSQVKLSGLETEHAAKEETIAVEQTNISVKTLAKEEALVAIAQSKTALEGLQRKIVSDEETLRMVEDAFNQDNEEFLGLSRQKEEGSLKRSSLTAEITGLEEQIADTQRRKEEAVIRLQEVQVRYDEVSSLGLDFVKQIEGQRKELEEVQSGLYETQMKDKDLEFKYLGLKERMLNNYKFDLETPPAQETPLELPEAGREEPDPETLSSQIQELKNKVESYGTVNLVAIEEYDELKQRYDFLNQQQNDLMSAKQSLHEAILKINRTTKQMFLETFEKVLLEFRNYFRMLFNGGEAQVYLIDEQDPLESGIEIICRPPGKKLQNVLLLSGGEKSMAAIALIFAIFKIKPSPFCVLDEIDAALDEANVDRFGRMLQEFASISQFIVITHNKKTIANADVMYGITMEESGVSKIVSVKFSKDKKQESPAPAAPEAVTSA
ncbi:MAG: AAA family ATPase [Candidatus Omnitrophica bacterium]|nr:AAA family ATPase [Candidatus Omnitrophota bacterium]